MIVVFVMVIAGLVQKHLLMLPMIVMYQLLVSNSMYQAQLFYQLQAVQLKMLDLPFQQAHLLCLDFLLMVLQFLQAVVY